MPGAADLGFAVPADLSIVSFDDGELLAWRLLPPLTTIQRPDRAMAEEAVTVTLQRLDEEGGAPIPVG
ncbi:MAG TPA: substrate-binding domain-containing protein [Propionibacteriaceae bacterium]|nr:substrate-binding domain-containing protein [Propionibacteriaceae bacterium]